MIILRIRRIRQNKVRSLIGVQLYSILLATKEHSIDLKRVRVQPRVNTALLGSTPNS